MSFFHSFSPALLLPNFQMTLLQSSLGVAHQCDPSNIPISYFRPWSHHMLRHIFVRLLCTLDIRHIWTCLEDASLSGASRTKFYGSRGIYMSMCPLYNSPSFLSNFLYPHIKRIFKPAPRVAEEGCVFPTIMSTRVYPVRIMFRAFIVCTAVWTMLVSHTAGTLPPISTRWTQVTLFGIIFVHVTSLLSASPIQWCSTLELFVLRPN